MTSSYLNGIDLERNMARFYRITVTPTLFGDWALIREWGRIGSPGTVREEWFETVERTTQAAVKLNRQKPRRGYPAVGG
ncbi:WGR domain-containing protein [Methylocaldum sp. BRCS4]|jgi:predicted DNA-binding WGR domain protein|nr:WGR domain-containing protein [Methylocaldum sp. BRCS4]